MTETGIVKWFNSKKGYGFIIRDNTPVNESNEIFVHYTAIKKSGFKSLNPGDTVSYEVKPGKKPGSVEAYDVEIIPGRSAAEISATLSTTGGESTTTKSATEVAEKLANNPQQAEVIKSMITKANAFLQGDKAIVADNPEPKKVEPKVEKKVEQSTSVAKVTQQKSETPDIENLKIVESAKKEFEKGNYYSAKELFRRSREICKRENWTDGVRYAQEMIEKCEQENK